MKSLIASVGTVRLFDPATNALIVTAKTLTDSGLNLGVTAEEARGGQGNVLLGKYYHDTSFGLTLTDQLFDLEYLALNCGGQITAGGNVLVTEQVTVGDDGAITVTGTPVALSQTIVGWAKRPTESDELTTTLVFSGSTAESSYTKGEVICVTYLKNVASARQFKVSSTFIPSVVHAIMTVPLFKASESETLSSSSQIGELVVDVPQFQLEGTQDLALTASGMASTSLSGSALANYSGADSCSTSGYYAIITEHIFDRGAYDYVKAIAIEDSDVDLEVAGTQRLVVWALYSDGTAPSIVPASELTFTSDDDTYATVDVNGVVTGVASGSTNIEAVVTAKTSLIATARVTVG